MSLKESEKVELKKSTSELKEAIISVVSILNKHGNGEVYFGVKNDGSIVGQAITENTVREVSKAISDHIRPEIYPTIKAVKISGKDCLNICFSGKDAPYYAFGRVYLRSGDVDRQVSPSKIKEIILGKNKSLWETGRSDKTLNDISKKKLKDYIKKANEAERISFKYSDTKTTLNKLGLMKDGRLLKAAEVLFCKDGSPEVQAAIFAGTDKTTFLDISQLRGNIFELLNKSREYISAHMNWRAELSGEGRKEIPEIPVRAIEEAVVNSLCHRDYSNPKGNEIAFFKDRIEIYNP